MYYIRRYTTNYSEDLFKRLENYKVKCSCFPITASPDTYTSMNFTLDESSLAFGELEPYLPEATPVEDHLKLPAIFDIKNPFKDPCTSILYEPVYTEEERKSAEWLEMQAISRKVQILNEETFFARSCIYGKRNGAPCKLGIRCKQSHLWFPARSGGAIVSFFAHVIYGNFSAMTGQK